MKKTSITAVIVCLSMIAFGVYAWFSGQQLNEGFVGKILIVGAAVASLVEAVTACYIVLTSEASELGKLGEYRLALTVGLVAGLIFAGLTCAREFGVDVNRRHSPPADNKVSTSQ